MAKSKYRENSISYKYSKAYFELLIEKKLLETGKSDLSLVNKTINESDELNRILNNETVENREKKEIVNSLFSSKINNITLNFIDLLIDSNRFNLIKEINENFIKLYKNYNNIIDIDVISAIELNIKTKERLIKELEKKYKRTIEINYIVNPDIIGGLIIKKDDMVIDGSIKNKYETLKYNLIN